MCYKLFNLPTLFQSQITCIKENTTFLSSESVKCENHHIRWKLPCFSITEYEAKNPRPETWIPLMNCTVISLLFDSIELFICNPRPQYLPRMKEKQIFGMIHKVNIIYNVGNRIIIVHQAEQTRYYINLKWWLDYYSGEKKKKNQQVINCSNDSKGKTVYSNITDLIMTQFPVKHKWQGIKTVTRN